MCPRCGSARYWGDDGCARCKVLDQATADRFAVEHGGRFIQYRYCVSVLLLTFRATTVKFVRSDQSRVRAGRRYTLISLVAGWWGIPSGLIGTLEAIRQNRSGGIDVTAAVIEEWEAAVSGGSEPPPGDALHDGG
jgi:hypothetical protein